MLNWAGRWTLQHLYSSKPAMGYCVCVRMCVCVCACACVHQMLLVQIKFQYDLQDVTMILTSFMLLGDLNARNGVVGSDEES